MLIFYLAGLTGLNNDKNDKFCNLLKMSQFHIYFNEDYKPESTEISQSKLARIWGVSQATVSHYFYKKKINLKLAKIVLKNKNFISFVDHIKVGNSKIINRNSISFIIKEFL